MCVKNEVWVLLLSAATLLPVSMATAARRLRNGIFNHLLCLQMYLITDHTLFLLQVLMQARRLLPPVCLPFPWVCGTTGPAQRFGAFGGREMGIFCWGSKWEPSSGEHQQCLTAVPAQQGSQQGAPRAAAGHTGAGCPGKNLWSSCRQLLCFQVQCLLSSWICKMHGFGKMPRLHALSNSCLQVEEEEEATADSPPSDAGGMLEG